MGYGLGIEQWRGIGRATKRSEGMRVFKRSRVVSWEMVWGMNSANRYAMGPNVAKGRWCSKGLWKERLYPHFSTTLSFYAMQPEWLCPESGGDWVRFCTVAEAIKHLKTKGLNVWPAHLIRAAEKGVSRSGWSFRFTSPDEDAAVPPHPRVTPHSQYP